MPDAASAVEVCPDGGVVIDGEWIWVPEKVHAALTRYRDALEEIAVVPEWWQGKLARKALS